MSSRSLGGRGPLTIISYKGEEKNTNNLCSFQSIMVTVKIKS